MIHVFHSLSGRNLTVTGTLISFFFETRTQMTGILQTSIHRLIRLQS